MRGTNAPSRHRGTAMRQYPRIGGPATLPLFCLAPHGVSRASRIAPRAVSSYLAFSPLPALFSKNRRYVFCDTLRQPRLASGLPAYFTRHAAVWCSDFPPANPANAGLTSDHLPSAGTISQSGKQENRRMANCRAGAPPATLISATGAVALQVKWRRNRDEKNDNHCHRDDELGEHSANVPKQTPPTRAAGIDHSL